MTNTNIDYWENIISSPTPAYQQLLDGEKTYLIDQTQLGAKVLDIGCGGGRNIMSILEKAGEVVGIDNDPSAVEKALNHFKGNSKVKIIEADVTKLPFENKTFDIITFIGILGNLDRNKVPALIEAKRVLRDDGKIILTTFSENAFDERMKVYKQSSCPIKEIRGTTVIFDDSLGANVSEQFSKEDIELLCNQSGLKVSNFKKAGDISNLYTLTKE